MDLHWLGHACFRLRGRTATLVTDPYAADVGKLGPVSADVVTVSHAHPGHANAAAVGGARKVLRGPGEYEIGGVTIVGVSTAHDAAQGREQGRNVVFAIELDGVSVCHLGDLGHVPTADQVEAIGRVDVLLLPVGARARLSGAQAVELVSLIDPKVVVPMHHRVSSKDGDDAGVAALCRQLGAPIPQPQGRLTLNVDALPEERQVVALDVRRAADLTSSTQRAA